MCISFVHISSDPCSKYKLIVLSNRDEVFERPALSAAWRQGILGGVDVQAGGTWLGVSEDGRVGILLSITQPEGTKNPKAPSRGDMPYDYLKQCNSANEFLNSLKTRADKYNGFQFLCLERNEKDTYEMSSLTNLFVDKHFFLTPGTHVISNSPIDKPLQKTIHGKRLFEDVVPQVQQASSADEVIEILLKVANDQRRCMPDDQLVKQVGRASPLFNDLVAPLSAIFVRFPSNFRYGTRTHTVFVVDQQNNATFFEKRIEQPTEDIENAAWKCEKFTFKLSNKDHVKHEITSNC
ncbi:hypothetical protein WR25_21907 [Diploscapter pachys]|uniref:Transport and Golgi organization protein 2 homolog n=1 Tax=Diploscapter pachys TaxID=2018661 RepID=A0A2A2LYI9_9BILA|nr:hypothetical protein WR25_21907 [Diploscapter pachys]